MGRPRSASARSDRTIVTVAVCLALLNGALFLFSLVALDHPSLLDTAAIRELSADATRYHSIARAHGTPYRDFDVEYPPLTVGAIEVLDGKTAADTAKQVGALSIILSLGVAALLLILWKERAALWYLGLTVPLALFVYLRLDVLSVVLALLSIALLRWNRDRGAGVALGLAVLTKVWPLALAPLFFVERRWRAAWWWAGTLVVGFAAWISLTGWKGPGQVVTLRGAHGWQIESLVGAVVLTFTGAPQHHEAGAVRVGSAPHWAQAIFLAVGALVILLAWMGWRRADEREAQARWAVRAAIAVSIVLLTSSILSPQYLIWMLPWVAIAASEHRRLALLTAAITILTTLIWFLPYRGIRVIESIILTRNVALVLFAVAGLWWLRTSSDEPLEPGERSIR